MKDRKPIVKSLNPHEIRKGLKARKENQALELLDAHTRSYNSLWDLFTFSKKKVIEQSKELSEMKSRIEAMKADIACVRGILERLYIYKPHSNQFEMEERTVKILLDHWKIKEGE